MKTTGFVIRSVICILAISLLASLAFACTEPAATSTPADTSTSAATPAESAATATTEVIELSYATQTPSAAPKSQLQQAWGDMIEEQTGGKVKFTFYWAGALVPEPEIIKAVETGVADISEYAVNIDFHPLSYRIMSLPFMNYPSMEGAAAIFWELYEKYPAIKDEWDGVQILSGFAMPQVQLHTVNKQVRLPEDLKGMKIYSNVDDAAVVDLAGGAPVELVSVGDLYIGLERGMVEGVNIHFSVLDAFGCTSLTPYHTIFGDGGISQQMDCILMNPEVWNSLTPDIQQVFLDAGEWFDAEVMKSDATVIAGIIDNAGAAGQTVTYLTPEELQVWTDLAAPVYDEWFAETEADGIPGEEIYNEAKRLISEYSE